MSYSSGLKVCDYVTLHSNDTSSHTEGVYTWNIPQSYYTNQRSQVCTVTCARRVALIDSNNLKGSIYTYENNGYNHFASSGGRPVIAYAHVNSVRAHEIQGAGELLTSARPQQISIKVTDLAKVVITATTTFSITLKFTYYNAIETARDLQNEKTVHL